MNIRGRKVLIGDNQWVWSFVGALIILGIIAASVHGRGIGSTFQTALGFASFYVIVGIGEMLVISTGPGNIDLSIPSVMTLAGYLAMGVAHADNSRLLLCIFTAFGVGAAAGIVNILLIRGVRIPPMVATMASGFVMQSMSIAYSTGSTASPAPLLIDFSTAKVFGLPLIAVIFIVVAIFVSFVLARTTFGRSILAVGQNERAAYLAGISTRRTSAAVYLLSSVAAGVCGLLLASYSGGASLNMSSGFLLMALAVVVLGGTSIAGGKASVAGVWGASLFLYLTVAMLNVLGLTAGVRYALTGVIIIAVLAVSKPSVSSE